MAAAADDEEDEDDEDEEEEEELAMSATAERAREVLRLVLEGFDTARSGAAVSSNSAGRTATQEGSWALAWTLVCALTIALALALVCADGRGVSFSSSSTQ